MGSFLSTHKGAADTADFITIQTWDLNRNRIVINLTLGCTDFPSESTHKVGWSKTAELLFPFPSICVTRRPFFSIIITVKRQMKAADTREADRIKSLSIPVRAG